MRSSRLRSAPGISENPCNNPQVYEQLVKPQFQWLQVTEEDWKRAAQLWADAANKGKVLSDIDLLIAAIAQRLGAIFVSADTDFDELLVKRVNWRIPEHLQP